jgi:serine/threonine-protein kinase
MRIGRYEIRGLLGRGGMGAVYKAAMPVTGRIVALKVLKPAEIMEDLVGEEALWEMFFKEASAMASIHHPNIAAVLDVGGGDGGSVPPHFTMEYFCGNLGALMGETYEVERESRRLGVETSLSMARGMIGGLDRLHYEGLVHRDVKPFNVMLAEDQGGPGTVKLIDFGLSKLRGERTPHPKGMVVGSPYYAAPEQEADPESADERSDLYSVGVTLYRMLTGRLPDDKGAAPIREVHADLDQSWDDFFASALARDPADRFPDGAAMLAALDELETRWRERLDAVCAAPDLLAGSESIGPCPPPRSGPLKVGLRQGREAFGLDELWRPECYAHGEFADQGDGTVLERTRGLVWERYGSRYPLTWERANAHVARLNKNAYGGRIDWRLPTVAELTTLFTGRTEPGEFCQEPAFDPQKARLWSADRKAFTAAWYVDAELGFVWWQDLTCRFFARAVAG